MWMLGLPPSLNESPSLQSKILEHVPQNPSSFFSRATSAWWWLVGCHCDHRTSLLRAILHHHTGSRLAKPKTLRACLLCSLLNCGQLLLNIMHLWRVYVKVSCESTSGHVLFTWTWWCGRSMLQLIGRNDFGKAFTMEELLIDKS